MTLIVCVAGFALIRRFAGSPLGYAIRGGRDSPLRAEAIGIHLDNHQWAAFVIAGGFAGVAGALFVFSKGSIFPDELAIPRSVDGLIMVLMGGLQSLFGPLLGAARVHADRGLGAAPRLLALHLRFDHRDDRHPGARRARRRPHPAASARCAGRRGGPRERRRRGRGRGRRADARGRRPVEKASAAWRPWPISPSGSRAASCSR